MKNLQYFCTRFRERHSGATNEPGKRVKFYRKQNFFCKNFGSSEICLIFAVRFAQFGYLVKHEPQSGKRSLDDWKIKTKDVVQELKYIFRVLDSIS